MHGVMLPGLGADIESLDTREWSEAVKKVAEELQRHHSILLLVGYSMGGALALHAAKERPDGLVLLAPFGV